MTLVNAGGNMCKKCFNAYDRCTKQIETLQQALSNAAEVLQASLSHLQQSEVQPLPPPPKRVAVAAVVAPSTSASPEVSVNIHVK